MISSRTAEGIPHRCPLCSVETPEQFLDRGPDAACPRCGAHLVRSTNLLNQLRTLAQKHPGLELVTITADSPWPLGGDSLTAVEVMLELENELGVSISARDVERIYTVGEAIRYFEARLRKKESSEGPRASGPTVRPEAPSSQ
jgi:acyl carrier protein